MASINVKKLENLSTEDIYCLLLPQIEELYTKYDYIPLVKEYYEEVILNCIEEILLDTNVKDIRIDNFVHKLEICLQDYLKSLGLLDEEDIISHNKKISTIKIRKTELLSSEKEMEIILRAKQGDKEAMEKIILGNNGLLYSIAWTVKKESKSSIDFEDFCQEGIFAIYKAVEKYDIKKGVRFSSYITKAIYHHLIRFTSIYTTMHQNYYFESNLFKETYENLEATFDKISLQSIADVVGISYQKAIYYYDTLFPLSLDSIIDEDGTTLGDTIIDENAISLEEYEINIYLLEEVKKVFSSLTPRRQKILALRYGFVDGKSYKQTEIAKLFGVPKQSINQAELIALRKLRQIDD